MDDLVLLIPWLLGGAALYAVGKNIWRRYRVDRATCLVCGSPDVDGISEGSWRTPDLLEEGYRCRKCDFDESDRSEAIGPYYGALRRLDAERSSAVRAQNTASLLSLVNISPNEYGNLQEAADRLGEVRETIYEVRDEFPDILDLELEGRDVDLQTYLERRLAASQPTSVPVGSPIGYARAAWQLSTEADDLRQTVETTCETLRRHIRDLR